MRFTLITADKTVYVDGDPRVVSLEMPPGVAAVQWDGDLGEVEFIDKSKPNKRIYSPDGIPPEPFRKYLDAHRQAKARDEAAS